MLNHKIAFFLLAMLPMSNLFADVGSTPAGQQYQQLLDQFEQEGGARTFAKRFLALAEEHPQDPVATDALLWVVTKVRGRADTDVALRRLTQNHLQSDKLGPACADFAGLDFRGGNNRECGWFRNQDETRQAH